MISSDVVDLVSSDDDSDGDGSEHFYVARASFGNVDDADGAVSVKRDLKGDEAEDEDEDEDEDNVECDGAYARDNEKATMTTSGQNVHHHLYSFDQSYAADGENFTQARGDVGTETYEALARYVKDEIDLTTASDDVKEKVDRLKKAWEEWPAKQRAQLRQNYLKHLEAFVHDFAVHGDFEKARGEIEAPRCVALLELSRTADDLDDLHVEMLKRYKTASSDWAREEKKRKLWTACAHLEEFTKIYSKSGDFEEARGPIDGPRNCAILTLTPKAITGSLPEIWQKRVNLFKKAKADWNAQQKTKLGPATAKHLRNFIQEFAQHGDFRRARGKAQTTRYGCLSKLADMLPGELSEPYRSQLRLLRSAWAEYTQQQQTTTLRRHRVDEDAFAQQQQTTTPTLHRADEDAFAQQQQTTTPTLHRADEDAFDDVHRQELQNFIFDFHSRDCFEEAFRGSVSVNDGAESTRQKALVHLLGLRENDIPLAYIDMWRTLKLAHEVHEKDVQLAQAQEAHREEIRRQTEEAHTRELVKVEEAHQRARLEAEAQQRTCVEAAEAHEEKSLEVKPQREALRENPEERMITALEQDRLKAFAESWHQHGDWKRARGETSPVSPRYQTLAKVRTYDKARIPPPLWSAFDTLIACWPHRVSAIKPPNQATLNPRYCSPQSRLDQSDAAQRPHLVPAKRASSPATTLDADVDDRATKTQRVDPPSISSDEDHLIAFFEEYKKHRDFDRARGDKGSERYAALLRLNARNGEEFSDPKVCRRVCKLHEMWTSVNYF